MSSGMARLNTFKKAVMLFGLFQFCGASQIIMTGNPPVIRDGVTDALHLRCSLENSTSEVVDREQRNMDTDTSHCIKHVSSIVVSLADPAEGEVIVAKVISSGKPEIGSEFDNLVVNGRLSPDTIDDPQFLEMTWSRPSFNQAGRYTCEIYTIDSVGRCVTFTADQSIGFQTPDVQELIGEINLLKDSVKEMKAVLKTLKAPHYEEGSENCERSTLWPRRINVQFQTPYETPPMIHLAVLHVDISSAHNGRYVIGKTDVTSTGFTITCSTWADTVIYGLTVAWTSSAA